MLIRLIGIGWGLPKDGQNFSLHPDEDIIWAYSQRIEPAKGKFEPGFYNYGTLYLTVLRISSDIVAGYGGGPKENDPESFYRYVGSCNLAGRIVNAIAGSLSVALLFLIALRFMSTWGAYFAAAAMAIAPGLVVHARFQTVDIFATFLLLCSIFFALKLMPSMQESPPREPTEEGKEPEQVSQMMPPLELISDKVALKLTLLSGLFAGLSAGTKYTGILAVLVLVAVHMILKRSDRWKLTGLGVLASLIGTVIGTPGILLNTSKFIENFKYEMLHTAEGHGVVFEGLPSGFLWHLNNLWIGFGGLLLVLGIAGCFLAFRQKAMWLIAVIAFAIPYYILIGRAEVLFLRYTFPLMIPLALGFGYFVSAARQQGTRMGHISVVFGIIALGGALYSTSTMTSWMAGTDPRDRAASLLRSIAKESPTDITVGIVSDPWFYTPTLFPNAARPRDKFETYLKDMAATEQPKVVRYVSPEGTRPPDWDVRLLTETKPDYVVFSSFEADDLKRLEKVSGLKPEIQAQVDQFKTFTKKLFEDYEPLVVLGRTRTELTNLRPYAIHDLEYIRPYIWIWKHKQLSSTTPSSGS